MGFWDVVSGKLPILGWVLREAKPPGPQVDPKSRFPEEGMGVQTCMSCFRGPKRVIFILVVL